MRFSSGAAPPSHGPSLLRDAEGPSDCRRTQRAPRRPPRSTSRSSITCRCAGGSVSIARFVNSAVSWNGNAPPGRERRTHPPAARRRETLLARMGARRGHFAQTRSPPSVLSAVTQSSYVRPIGMSGTLSRIGWALLLALSSMVAAGTRSCVRTAHAEPATLVRVPGAPVGVLLRSTAAATTAGSSMSPSWSQTWMAPMLRCARSASSTHPPDRRGCPTGTRTPGGIRAFYFRDPDRHVMEALQFPPGKGEARWRPALPPCARGAPFWSPQGWFRFRTRAWDNRARCLPVTPTAM